MVAPTCFLHLYLCSASFRHGSYICFGPLFYLPHRTTVTKTMRVRDYAGSLPTAQALKGVAPSFAITIFPVSLFLPSLNPPPPQPLVLRTWSSRYTNTPIRNLGSGIPVMPVPVYLFFLWELRGLFGSTLALNVDG